MDFALETGISVLLVCFGKRLNIYTDDIEDNSVNDGQSDNDHGDCGPMKNIISFSLNDDSYDVLENDYGWSSLKDKDMLQVNDDRTMRVL